jgi:hypothetical protein
VKPGGLARIDPQVRLHADAGQPRELTVKGRPGDRYQVFVAASLREIPEWTLRGANWLPPAERGGPGAPAPATIVLPQILVAGDDGMARLPVPQLTPGRAYVQLLAVPRGEPDGATLAARWTPVTELEIRP